MSLFTLSSLLLSVEMADFPDERHKLNVFLSDSADCAKQMVQPIKTNFAPPKSIIADWL